MTAGRRDDNKVNPKSKTGLDCSYPVLISYLDCESYLDYELGLSLHLSCHGPATIAFVVTCRNKATHNHAKASHNESA